MRATPQTSTRQDRARTIRRPRCETRTRPSRFGQVLLVLLTVFTAGCTSSSRWGSLGGTPVAEQAVYEAVVRYIHVFYDPPSWNPEPQAWCLATDRRSSRVFRERTPENRSEWSPPPRLLSLLADLQPPVRPDDDCGRDGEDAERLLDGGGPAVVLALDYPTWETAELARVVAWTRQDRRAFNRFVCRLSRTTDGWQVLECL